MISTIVGILFQIIWVSILIVILLSWVPNIDWYKQPFQALRNFTELFLSPFRRIIPPIGGLDISPIFALLFLQFVGDAITYFLHSKGL